MTRRKRKGNPLFKPIPMALRPGDAPVYLALQAVYRMGWYLWARNEVDDFDHAKEFFSCQLEASMTLNDLRAGWTDAVLKNTKEMIDDLERSSKKAKET